MGGNCFVFGEIVFSKLISDDFFVFSKLISEDFFCGHQTYIGGICCVRENCIGGVSFVSRGPVLYSGSLYQRSFFCIRGTCFVFGELVFSKLILGEPVLYFGKLYSVNLYQRSLSYVRGSIIWRNRRDHLVIYDRLLEENNVNKIQETYN